MEYVPPFSFEVTEDGSLDKTTGTPIHDIMALVYKQRDGNVSYQYETRSRHKQVYPLQVDMAEERQSGCNPEIVGPRITDHVKLAEKYNLELVAGNFFFTTYTKGTNVLLCYTTKCSGEAFPFPVPGINDGPECT